MMVSGFADLSTSLVIVTHSPLFSSLGGCFVTKVSPDGSAARSGGVEVGDQLAAINGTVGNKMTIDNICSLIAKSPHQNVVNLVLLRYIGPLRPSQKIRVVQSHELEAERNPRTPSKPKIASNTKKKKRGFLLFGTGKKRGSKSK